VTVGANYPKTTDMNIVFSRNIAVELCCAELMALDTIGIDIDQVPGVCLIPCRGSLSAVAAYVGAGLSCCNGGCTGWFRLICRRNGFNRRTLPVVWGGVFVRGN